MNRDDERKGIPPEPLIVYRMGKLLASRQLLWVGSGPVPDNVRDAARIIGDLATYDEREPLDGQLRNASLALVRPNGHREDPDYTTSLMAEIQSSPAVGVFLLQPEDENTRRMVDKHEGHFLCAEEGIPADKLAIQLSAAAAIQPRITKLETELSAARDLNDLTNHTLEEVDEEMRLAARLQRDFLPRRLPEVGPAKFGVLYRPATWVSGDIYDIVRLDETHVGFYVADVVGHGMPAALLTMFIKKAMQTKRIVGNSYQIVPPHISLRELNLDICDQNLPSCQFCTAVYCVLDTENLTLTHSRGGHPEPVVLHSNGKVERIWVQGSLLGIFPGEEYQSATYQLRKGDRLLVYTDGAESLLGSGPVGQESDIDESFARWSQLTQEEMLLQLTAAADSRADNDPRRDDVTVVALDLEA